ncbi:hypothetical protein ACR8AL_09365 [Clavibacter sepedonicus]|uniref:Membrane protein n=1 Tax=Clavibacter sepedonicus TaxID=31964 RepID=B0RJ05_CLASE|nr:MULTISPECIES: hypothetical protein [Clavibacter]MBD5382675.1 hypothetical protein [Clavibacter sp.]OQJ45049.1 hypothetical protein B5P19_15770 [Clavibacter sepedonicus]OQJ50928.1 hypothetical protein B5P20_15980 [Clavibacter sepedonicus]UUK67269.1 hypothetical protein LRE50_16045 [Clavibacter sepedonicus]CAQ03193.1 putative membrane protein [Clavibacter sepedonicus]
MSTLHLIADHFTAVAAGTMPNPMGHITVLAEGGIPNPLDNIVPDFSIFGTKFNQLWQKILAGIWGLMLIASVLASMLGLGRMAMSGGASGNPQKYQDAKSGTIVSGSAFGVLAALGVIVGAVLFFVSL